MYICIYKAKAKVYHTRNTVDDWFESARYRVSRVYNTIVRHDRVVDT